MPWGLILRIVGPLALLAVLAFGVRWALEDARSDGRRAGEDAVRAEWAAAQAEVTREALRLEQRRTANIQGVNDAYAKETRAARAAAAGARTELQRLLDIADERQRAAAEAPEPAGGADGAAGAWPVVRACASSLVRLAEAADATEARLAALQAWVRGVLMIEPAAAEK